MKLGLNYTHIQGSADWVNGGLTSGSDPEHTFFEKCRLSDRISFAENSLFNIKT